MSRLPEYGDALQGSVLQSAAAAGGEAVKASRTTLRRHASVKPAGRGIILPAFHPAAIGARSIFPSRVFAPDEVQRVLKDGHQSRKIGKTIMKGKRAGWPIYTLTLEERASCPRSCREWLSCYGSNMQAAERIEHGADLEAALWTELADLQSRHPGGFLVRLHVLGDFYSTDYVDLWRDAVDRFPALNAFGFTAHRRQSEIGLAVAAAIGAVGWSRFAIRFSGAEGPLGASRVIGAGEDDPDGILCPAQTGATDCCATCALCWQSDRSIVFRRH